MKLTHYINRYRTLNTWAFCFPKDIDPMELTFYGFVLNNGISKLKGLSLFSFDSVSYTGERNGFVRCLCLVNGRLETVIFKK